MTVWDDHESLNAFVQSIAHQAAMREGWPALTTARFARIEVDRSDIPFPWKQAEKLLDTHGRTYTNISTAREVSNAWGVSNNIRPMMRAPRFREAKFEIKGDEPLTLNIEIGK